MEPTYNRNPEWHTTRAIIPAIIVIGIGVLFLLNNLNIIYIRNWIDYWPVILIAIGLEKVVDSNFIGRRMGGGVLMFAGGLFLARNLGYLQVQIRDLWPLVLIFLGLFMLWSRTRWTPGSIRRPAAPLSEHTFNDNAIFGGVKRNVTTSDFQGGHVNAVFGGADLNLRRASMVGDSAVLEIDAVCGGVELKVPDNWSVILQGTGVFGGYSDETIQPPPGTPGVKKLYVRGSAVFGGVVVKN
jgi:predicted membrane protein